jgi:Tol biopolymer transport system component
VWAERAFEEVWADQGPAWSPDATKLAMSLDHRNNIILVNLAQEIVSDLAAQDTLGRFPSDPVFSPDGNQIVFFSDSIQIFSLTDGTSTRFSTVGPEVVGYRPFTPVHWASDGNIYAVTPVPWAIYRISPSDSTHELYVEMPFNCREQVVMTPDARSAICATPEFLFDVFVIDNFGPGLGR